MPFNCKLFAKNKYLKAKTAVVDRTREIDKNAKKCLNQKLNCTG